MDTGTLSVKKIFGQDRRHIVPLFQRPYVWEREKQWEPFWADIRSLADRLLDGKEPRPHFLGAIVLDQLSKPTGHVETRLVIDGQQRLTTLQIFLEAFCDLCNTRGVDKHHRALLKLTRNDDPMSEDDDEVFKVWPTNVDQEHFRRVMKCSSPKELRKHYGAKPKAEVGHPIADGYLYFYDAIDEWLGEAAEALDSRLDVLFNAVRDYVRLVVIDLDKEDDAQLIFETLNARGTPLLPSDLVKNYLFHRAQLAGVSLEPLYDEFWRFFDEDPEYWRREQGRGHARRRVIDTFLLHYLTLQRRDDVSVAHLYVVFREFAAQKDQPGEILASIKQYADIYREFDDFPNGSREGLFFERIATMDITTAYPFLLALFAEHRGNEEAVYAVLDDLESFLVRRMVCQLNTRGYNQFFLELLKTVTDDSEETVSGVRKFLLNSDADSSRWPSDNEFKQAWLEYPLYRNLAKNRLRMLLEGLERKMRTGKSEKMQLEEKLTIEHLMPQKWHKHWPLSEENDGEPAEQERDRTLHTMGNLSLVTHKLNPAISNGPWQKKKADILEHSLLRLNRALEADDEWDEERINRRGKKLFDVATSIWPYPGK